MIDFNRDNVKRIVIVRSSPAIDFAKACAKAVEALQRFSESLNKGIDFDEVSEAFKRFAEQAERRLGVRRRNRAGTARGVACAMSVKRQSTQEYDSYGPEILLQRYSIRRPGRPS